MKKDVKEKGNLKVRKRMSLNEAEETITNMVRTARDFYQRNESLKTWMKFRDLKLKIYQAGAEQEEEIEEAKAKEKELNIGLKDIPTETIGELLQMLKDQPDEEVEEPVIIDPKLN